MEKIFFVRSIILLGFLLVGGLAQAVTLQQQRDIFLQTEKLIQLGRSNSVLEDNFRLLKDYPLYPFIKYQWLKKNLSRTAEIESFLNRYKDTRYGALLRDKWLNKLAQAQNWKLFFKYYQDTTAPSLTCLYYWGKYQSGHKREALTAAQKLWVIGKSQARECDHLFSKLMQSPYFTQKIVWQRFDAALNKGNLRLASYVRKKMTEKNKAIADFWLKVHKNPSLVAKANLWKNKYPQKGHIFAYGVMRYARIDREKAIKLWDDQKNHFKIDTVDIQLVDRKLALSLAYSRDEKAYNRLKQLSNTDGTTRTWRVRSALQQNNWSFVNEALTSLTKKEKREPVWQYWQARAHEALGEKEKARSLYEQLSTDRSFYGFLAADNIKRQYHLADKPVRLEEGKVESLLQRPAFQMIKELAALNKTMELRRQWWFTVRSLNQQDLMAAAKLAQQWNWDQLAILTIARADYWDDVSMRFPVNYIEHVNKNAIKNDLDPSIILGLIRRESAFNQNARSPVGARGLMQIMPQTGRQIARNLKEKWLTKNSLFNPETNVKYGSYYYKKLLNRFNGHFALAAAAYNAGPHRVLKWLPKLHAVPADIWVETIPFTETRRYVAAVLAYALIYQKRMHRNTLKMKDFMRDVLPE